MTPNSNTVSRNLVFRNSVFRGIEVQSNSQQSKFRRSVQFGIQDFGIQEFGIKSISAYGNSALSPIQSHSWFRNSAFSPIRDFRISPFRLEQRGSWPKQFYIDINVFMIKKRLQCRLCLMWNYFWKTRFKLEKYRRIICVLWRICAKTQEIGFWNKP